IRVPAAVGDFMILDAIRESDGCAKAVPEGGIALAMQQAHALEGIAICPESAACLVAARQLVQDGRLRAGERIVLFNTASSLKYQEPAAPDLPRLPAAGQVDYERLVRGAMRGGGYEV